MKKTLFTALLLMASAFTAGAQGFRVYKTDGQVYQFHWAADSIAFFEGEGDPDYQEPVPESVQTALADMQARIDENTQKIWAHVEDNHARFAALENIAKMHDAVIDELNAKLTANAARMATLEEQEARDQEVIRTLKTQVEKDRDSITVLNTRFEDYSALVLQQRNDIMELARDNARNEVEIDYLKEYLDKLHVYCQDLQDQIDALKNQ